MIVVTTRGWTGAEIVWTHASGAATYTVSGDEQNAYAVAVALQAWLDDAARPWAADISAVTLTVEEAADLARVRFVFGFAGSAPTFTSKTPNATWIARFGDTSASPVGPCPASCSGRIATTLWERAPGREGAACRDASWCMEPASASLRLPSAELALTRAQAWAWGDAKRRAAQPRRAYVYDEMGQAWRLVWVGEDVLEHPDDDVSLVTGTLQLAGGL
jgi:hypothetical protein